MHPLVLGRLDRGWVVASETAALDIVGASYVREVEPGELLAIDEDGIRSERFASAEPKGCIFEYVYLARPDTTISGRGVHATRVEIGRRLAQESPVEADLVIPTPESGTPAAIGYAQESGIPYGQGLVKNAYVGRTFIQPSQTIRQLGIRLKLNPLRDVIRGKRLVVVDDSIVRGNTQRALVRMLREAGALEVHVRIASPPVRWPCFYGLDFGTRAELIASSSEVDDVRRSIGADTLGYISLESLVAATEQPRNRLCTACFSGEYPIASPTRSASTCWKASGAGSPGRRRRPVPPRPWSPSTAPSRWLDLTPVPPPQNRFPPDIDGGPGRPAATRATAREWRAHTVNSDAPGHHRQSIGTGATYAGSGSPSPPAKEAVDLMKPYTEKTHRPEVMGGIGGFASLFKLPVNRFREPVLASSSDGVGTKSAIAQALDIHDTIGIDLVAMVVDDLVACGAEPLFLQDYIACGQLDPSGSPPSCRASPPAASGPAARWSAARPPSIPA